MPRSRQSPLKARLPLLLGVALFAVVGYMTELLIQTQKQSAALSRNIEVHSELYAVREQLDRSLSNVLSLSIGLSAYVEAKSGEVKPEEMTSLLRSLYGRSEHIRNFGLAKGTTIRYVYPIIGNEAALGVDYKDVPNQWPDVLVAMNSPDGILAGPVELLQGGKALIFRIPVLDEDQYWGLFSIVIEMSSYLEEITSKRIGSKGELSVQSVRGEQSLLLTGDEGSFADPNAQIVDVAIPGGHWQIAMVPKPPEYAFIMPWRFLGWTMALLLGGGVSVILAQRSALQGLALVDELTGVANRRQFDLMLDRFCEKYGRRDSGSFALLYVDLDKFKSINDNHGHRAGDYFLIEVAKRIGQATRGGDLLARWGGDEFALLLDNPSDASIDHVVTRVRELAEQPIAWRDVELKVGASIGVVKYPEDGTTPEALLSVADQKMYNNKKERQEQA